MKYLSRILFTMSLAIQSGTAFCGDNYPKTIVVNGDTVVAITRAQRDEIFFRLNECKEMSVLDSLNQSNEQQIKDFRKLSETLVRKSELLAENYSGALAIISEKDQVIAAKDQIIKLQTKKDRRAKLRTIFITVPTAISVGTFTGFLIAR